MAPLAGTVILSSNANEVIIIDSGELPVGTALVITNIYPVKDIMHPDDPLYEKKKVSSYGYTMNIYNMSEQNRSVHIILTKQKHQQTAFVYKGIHC